MPIIFARETAADVERDIVPLMHAHDKDVAHVDFADWPLDVDMEVYRNLERIDKLRVFTARDAGELVGYCTIFIVRSHQRRSLTVGMEDALYLKPEYRKAGNAMRLITFVNEQLKGECEWVMYHAPAAFPRFGTILARTGYTKYSETYARRL
tara:strand:- start:196 stop:651 length:456 start_codon:yes stop_codon:yes gene_type:complete